MTHCLLEGIQQLQSPLVDLNLKLFAENNTAEVAKRVEEREHFLASHCVFLLWLRQRTTEVRQRLFDSGSDRLRQHSADAEVARITVYTK